jgi:Sfi1 spindle body protein
MAAHLIDFATGDDYKEFPSDLQLDSHELDIALVETASELARLADEYPRGLTWGHSLTTQLEHYSNQVHDSADAENVFQLRRLALQMINGAADGQSKVDRLHEVLNNIDPEYPRDATDAERIAQLREMGEMAQQVRDQSLLHSAFSHWRNTTEERTEQLEMAIRLIMMRRIWRAWTRIVKERRLKKHYFGLWRLQTRLRLARTEKQTPILAWSFNRLREETQLRQLAREGLQTHIRWVKIRAIKQWRNHVQFVRGLNSTAQDFRERKLKHVGMDGVVDHIEHSRFLHQKAEAANFYRLTSHALKIFRNKTTERIGAREEEARQTELKMRYKTHSQTKRVKMAQNVLSTWRERTQVETEERIARELRLDSTALEFDRQKKYLYVTNTLKRRAQRRYDLEESAQQFWTSRTQLVALDVLRSMSRIGTQAMARNLMVEQFAKRVEDRRMITIIQHWLSRSIQKRSGLDLPASTTMIEEERQRPGYLNTPSTRQRILAHATPHASYLAAPLLSTPITTTRQFLPVAPHTTFRNTFGTQTPSKQMNPTFRSGSYTAPARRAVTFASTARKLSLRPLVAQNASQMVHGLAQEVEFPDITPSTPGDSGDPHDNEAAEGIGHEDAAITGLGNDQEPVTHNVVVTESDNSGDTKVDVNLEFGPQKDDDPDQISLENEPVDGFDELDDELDSQPEQEHELEERLKMFQGRRGKLAAQSLFSRVLT